MNGTCVRPGDRMCVCPPPYMNEWNLRAAWGQNVCLPPPYMNEWNLRTAWGQNVCLPPPLHE